MKFINFKLIILVIVISVICGLPHLIGLYYQGDKYSLFTPTSSLSNYEEMYFYATRTKQIINGDFIPHDAHIFEYQKAISPYIGETLPSYTMAFFALVSGSIEKGFISADFIMPPLIFLLVYFFVNSISGKKNLSIVSSLGVVFVREIFIYFPYPVAMFKYLFFLPVYIDNLIITRSFHPEISLFFYLLAIFLIFRAIFSESKKTEFLAGLLLGLNFYNYIFYWTTLIFGLFIFFLFNLKNDSVFKKIVRIGLIGLLIALPYLFNILQFGKSSFAHDFFGRSTSFRSEFPLQRSVRFIIASIFIFVWLQRRRKKKYMLLNSFIMAAALLPDITLLLWKKDLESTHWIKMVVWPTATLFYPILLYEFFGDKLKRILSPGISKILFLIICLSFIYYGFNNQLASGNHYSKFGKLSFSEKQLVLELRKLPKKSVVAAMFNANRVSENINLFIPAMSDNLVFVPYPTMTVASTDEIVNRNLIMLFFFRTRSEILNFDIENIIINSYDWLNFPHIVTNKKAFQEQIKKKLGRIDIYCKKYKIDYILLEKGQILKQNCLDVNIVFQNSEYSLYNIK